MVARTLLGCSWWLPGQFSVVLGVFGVVARTLCRGLLGSC